MEWKTHTIPHLYQYHVVYHTMSPYTIPFDSIPYHQGCLGSFLSNMKSIFAGCNTCPLGSIFCGQVLQIFAVILSHKWRLQGECDPLKTSPIGFYARFWPFTLWIIHHKPLTIVYFASNLLSTTMVWPMRRKENKTFVHWLSVMNNARLYPL